MALDIFIPYWGDPEYMRETVASVLAQDNPDWLLTVVDDAYPDPSIGDYLTSLEDPRITYLRKDHNEGITANFRSCVALATQDIMVMVGCDDVLLPNYVDVVLAAHQQFPDAAIIQPGVRVIDETSAHVSTLADTVKQQVIKPRSAGRQLLSGESLAASLMHGVWLYWPSLTFRTDKIRTVDFRDGFPIIQDVALTMDLVYSGAQVLVDPTVCFAYRRHSESASSAKLVDGSRFVGERDYFELSASQARALGWHRAERAAKLRITSRAHALSLVPKAAAGRSLPALKVLLRHAFGS